MDPKSRLAKGQWSLQVRGSNVLLGLARAGYGRVRVVCVMRTLVQEMQHYGKGRTRLQCFAAGVPEGFARPNVSQVAWCLPRDSKHVKGLAMDVSWANYKAVDWDLVHEIAAQCCVTWGGDWDVRDYGHFEVPS